MKKRCHYRRRASRIWVDLTRQTMPGRDRFVPHQNDLSPGMLPTGRCGMGNGKLPVQSGATRRTRKERVKDRCDAMPKGREVVVV